MTSTFLNYINCPDFVSEPLINENNKGDEHLLQPYQRERERERDRDREEVGNGIVDLPWNRVKEVRGEDELLSRDLRLFGFK